MAAELDAPAATNGHGGTSHLDWLRRRHEAIKADRTLDVSVPGYSGRLVLRCGPVPWSIMSRVQALMAGDDPEARGALAAMSDAIIASTREVLVDGKPIDPTGETRRIDERLGELFGADTSSARATLEFIFPNPFAINAAAGELLTWTQEADADSAEEFAGK
jgi:hypothetical protein